MGREAGQQFLDFMQRHCSPQEAIPLLIAHNGRAFDIRFIHLELQRNSLALPDGALFFDTCIYARQIFPQINQPLPGYRQVTSSSGTSIDSSHGINLAFEVLNTVLPSSALPV